MPRRPASRCRLLHLRPVAAAGAARRARKDQQQLQRHRLNRRTRLRTYLEQGQLHSPPLLLLRSPSIPMLPRLPCLQEQPTRATLRQAQLQFQSIPRPLSSHLLLLLLLLPLPLPPPPNHPPRLHQIRASPLQPRSSRNTSTRQRSLLRPRNVQEPARQLESGQSHPLTASGGTWAGRPSVSLPSEQELWPGRWAGTGTPKRRSLG